MRSFLRAILAATTFFVTAEGVGLAQIEDPGLVKRAVDDSTEMLEQAMLQRGSLWYSTFQLATTKPENRPQGGFVETLKPKTEPRVANGMIEIEFLSPPRGIPSPDGSILVRSQIFKYRIWRPDTGWGPKTTIIANSFEWQARLVAGKWKVQSLNDARFKTSDCGVTGLISQIYGLKPEEIETQKADPKHRALPAQPKPGPRQPGTAR